MSDQILLIEDDRELRAFLTELLEASGYRISAHASAGSAVKSLGSGEEFDLVVTDLVLPGMSGQELLAHVRREAPELNVVVVTAFGSIDSAIELVKAGAFDYLTKPVASDELLFAIDRALTESKARRANAREARGRMPPAGFIGASQPMQELYRLLTRAAASPYPLLLTGESGTGKDLLARAAHNASGRSSFVAINCAAMPETLLESELFGHERGAFTGADRARPGLFETAHGGSLFLDEVGELPLNLQPKLLRALEHGEVRRVGATEARRFDVRIIAATNRDLEDEVRKSRFREDLFWRLNVLQLTVPPLRERPADIPLLAEHFLQKTRNSLRYGAGGGLAPSVMALLMAYSWPGNVRELRNVIERAVTLRSGAEVLPDDLPAHIRRAGSTAARITDSVERQHTLRELEHAYILEVLRAVGGNKSRAAELLDLDRKTLYRKLEEIAAGARSVESA